MEIVLEIINLLFSISVIYVIYIFSYVGIKFYQFIKTNNEDIRIVLSDVEKIMLLISLGLILNKII